jgi:hypothetical protein
MGAWAPAAFFSSLLNSNNFNTADKKLDCAELYRPEDLDVLLDALPTLTSGRAHRLLVIMEAYAVDLRAEHTATLDVLKGRRATSPYETKQHLAFLSDRLAEVKRVISCLRIQVRQPSRPDPSDGVLRQMKQALASWQLRHGETAATKQLAEMIEQADQGSWPIKPVDVQATIIPRLKAAHLEEVANQRLSEESANPPRHTVREALFLLAQAVIDAEDPTLSDLLDGLEIFNEGHVMPVRQALAESGPRPV